jgi:hypothetical protein
MLEHNDPLFVGGPEDMQGEHLIRFFTSLATDVTLGVTVIVAWFSDIQHAVMILAPLGLPVLFILRIAASIEDIKLRRQMRRNAELRAAIAVQEKEPQHEAA